MHPEQDLFIKTITHIIPTVSINVEESEFSIENSLLSIPALQHPRQVSLNVIIHKSDANNDSSVDYLNQLMQFVDVFTELAPTARRPQFLAIIFSRNGIFDNTAQSFLQYAWSKLFLDACLLIINSKESVGSSMLTQYVYNPFCDILIKNSWNPSLPLFPDKLRDMNGFSIKTAIFHYPPYLILTKNNNSSSTIDGLNFPMMDLMAQHLNFSLKSVSEINTNNSGLILKNFLDLVLNHEINISPIPFVFNAYDLDQLELGIQFDYFMPVALVPVIPQTQTHISSKMYVVILLSIIFIFFFHFLVNRVLKFDKLYWHANYIVRIFLSWTIPRTPLKTSERLLFILIYCVSLNQGNDVVMLLLQAKLVHESRSFDTIQDIDSSDLAVYIDGAFHNALFGTQDENIKSILQKAINVSHIGTCADLLFRSKRVICLCDLMTARNLLFDLKKRYTNLPMIMKIVHPFSTRNPMMLLYEKSSPYVEKFDMLMWRVLESGIKSKFKYVQMYQVYKELSNDQVNIEINILGRLVGAIFAIGMIVSVLTFLLELWYGYKRAKKHVSKCTPIVVCAVKA